MAKRKKYDLGKAEVRITLGDILFFLFVGALISGSVWLGVHLRY